MNTHWMTDELATELMEAAKAAGKMLPRRAAGGIPEAGPLKLVQLQTYECCGAFQLVIEGRHVDAEIDSPEDLRLAVQFAEMEAEPRVQ